MNKISEVLKYKEKFFDHMDILLCEIKSQYKRVYPDDYKIKKEEKKLQRKLIEILTELDNNIDNLVDNNLDDNNIVNCPYEYCDIETLKMRIEQINKVLSQKIKNKKGKEDFIVITIKSSKYDNNDKYNNKYDDEYDDKYDNNWELVN